MKRNLLPFALIAAFVAVGPVLAGCHKCAVKSYVGARNAHDADRIATLVTDQLRIVGPDGEMTLDRKELGELLAWDGATNARVSYQELVVEGDEVSGLFTETNDVFALLGLSGRHSRMAFRFEGDRIREIHVTPTDGDGPAVGKALEPFLAWASSRHPGVLDEIYPDGTIAPGAESAERWLALLREWRAG